MALQKQINIIVAANLTQVQKQLKKLLQLIEDIEILRYVNTAQEAVESLRELNPEVVLIDLSLPDMSGLKLTEIVRRDFPLTQVILFSQDKLYDTVLQAMRLGAADFFTLDVSFEDLQLSIWKAGEQSLSDKFKANVYPLGEMEAEHDFRKKAGKVITIFSPKGGVGVTTVAVNLAIALMKDDAEVLLVDDSLQFGDVLIQLNEVSRNSVLDLISNIYELDRKMVEEVVVRHKSSGIHVLPAPSEPELAEKVTGEHLSRVIEFLRTLYDYIIINTSAYISDPCLAALDQGDMVYLLTSQEIAAIRSVNSFLRLWASLNMENERIHLVLNHYDAESPLTPEKISAKLNKPITFRIPKADEMALNSVNLGVPIMINHLDKSSEMAKVIESMAEKVRGYEIPERVKVFSTVRKGEVKQPFTLDEL